MKKSFLGLFIVAVGVVMLLNVFGYIDFSVWRLWPLIFVYIGLNSMFERNRLDLFGLIIACFGVVLLLDSTGLVKTINLTKGFFPLLVIIFGLSLIFKMPKYQKRIVGFEGDYVNTTAVFSGSEERVISQSFKGGEATAVFGGVELDLSQAQFDDACYLRATAIFGGIDIRVPAGCTVKIVNNLHLFGGASNRCIGGGGKEIIIETTALFGGVDIK